MLLFKVMLPSSDDMALATVHADRWPGHIFTALRPHSYVGQRVQLCNVQNFRVLGLCKNRVQVRGIGDETTGRQKVRRTRRQNVRMTGRQKIRRTGREKIRRTERQKDWWEGRQKVTRTGRR